MKPETKTGTWLPLFPGFYGTIYEPNEDSEIEHVNSERESKGLESVDFNEFQFDYDEYHTKVVKGIINFIESNFSEFISAIELERIRSPKEYNFANDSADIIITLSEGNKRAIGHYLAKHFEAFRVYLKDRYTSCSGFISSYPNYPNSFLEDNPLEHAHKLGSILEFIFRNENKEDEDFDLTVYYSINDLYVSCINTDELINGIEAE